MGVSWLKQGSSSAELAKKEEAAKELRQAEKGKLFRFFLKDGEDASITFVDGDLSPEGFLIPPRFYEHNVKLNGKFGNTFVCPEQTDPTAKHKCPLCEGGDRPYLASLFTVIDHRTFEGEGGKKYTNTRKLLVAKPDSFEMLNKLAIKRGGLAGVRFDVSRSGDKSAAIGSMFDFTDKQEIEVLKAKYTRVFKDGDNKEVTVCDFTPADYENEITFRSEDELRKLGFGKASVAGGVSGFSGGADTGTAAGTPTNYENEL